MRNQLRCGGFPVAVLKERMDKMDAQIALNILKQAYRLSPFRVNNVIQFVKYPSDKPTSYQTIHGAFIFPLEGEAEIRFDNECFLAKPGTMVHGCPECQLTFRVLGENPFTHINLYYHQISSNLLFSMPIDLPAVSPALQNLVGANDHADIHSILQKQLLSRQVFQNIFFDDEKDHSSKDYLIVKELLDYIENNYRSPLTMEDLASHIGKSKSQLSYLFYKYTQCRPIDFLIDYRINMAAKLLRDQGCTVTKAADAVGYTDPLHFSRLFKKRTGYAPSQIQRKHISDRK